MKTLAKYAPVVNEALLWLGATFIAFVLGSGLGYLAVQAGLWIKAVAP